MKVAFNPNIKYNCSFQKRSEVKNKNLSSSQVPDKHEIMTAKTKKAVSECITIVLGVGILYFGTKRCFKINKAKSLSKKLEQLATAKTQEAFIPSNMKTEDFMGRLF